MPTGPAHDHVTTEYVGGELTQTIMPCRCTIGETHFDGVPLSVEDDEGESFAGAEEIYDSSGRDEDYDFR